MKVTSQMRSPTCVTPTFWPAQTWLRFTFRPLKQSPGSDAPSFILFNRPVVSKP
jgi:hypothetical protein